MDKKTPSKKKPANKSTTRKKAIPRKPKTATTRSASRRTSKPKTKKVVLESEVKEKKAPATKAAPKKKAVAKTSSRSRKRPTSTNNSNKANNNAKPVEQKQTPQKVARKKTEIAKENLNGNQQTKTYSNNNPNANQNKRPTQPYMPPQKSSNNDSTVTINQNVAILIDGNNIEKSIHSLLNRKSAMLDFDNIIPKLLRKRGLNRLIYFREGLHISSKLAERLHKNYFGTVVPCHKSADIPLSITATQLADKVDTIIILSGDSDYVDLVRHLRSRGVRVEIAAIKQTTAKILIDEADFFTEITRADCYVR